MFSQFKSCPTDCFLLQSSRTKQNKKSLLAFHRYKTPRCDVTDDGGECTSAEVNSICATTEATALPFSHSPSRSTRDGRNTRTAASNSRQKREGVETTSPGEQSQKHSSSTTLCSFQCVFTPSKERGVGLNIQ